MSVREYPLRNHEACIVSKAKDFNSSRSKNNPYQRNLPKYHRNHSYLIKTRSDNTNNRITGPHCTQINRNYTLTNKSIVNNLTVVSSMFLRLFLRRNDWRYRRRQANADCAFIGYGLGLGGRAYSSNWSQYNKYFNVKYCAMGRSSLQRSNI
ncbi:hypothetical protein Trydic_g16545 [Trypoxylus dichotomus]